ILETKMIRTRLEQLGFSQDEIQARLTQLNDQQIHQLALNLDKIKVGGGGLEILIVILLIGILVVLYLQYSGRKIVIQKK
ncbi:MAG: PA2779 family protein, partial [Deltaproteobacteria bacterium]|nr:PA2779 family protein [Deltaproteobacteria bacterium]